MKVRATQDGHYGGYVRIGPHEEADGSVTPGDVFEIDATPYPLKDEAGRPIQEMMQTGELNSTGQPVLRPVWLLDGNGKPKKDSHGNLIPKIRMVTMFAPEWMEPVNDDATVTYPNQEKPLGVLKEYQPNAKMNPSNVAARPVKLPDDITAVLGKQAESVI